MKTILKESFRLKFIKCKFATNEVEYLGQICNVIRFSWPLTILLLSDHYESIINYILECYVVNVESN